jgi:hypothetical protein
MKTIFLLLAAALTLAFAGCVSSPSPRYATRSEVIIGEDDYDYYPASEVYYSRAHHYYYYREGAYWVRRNDPPRTWARTAPSVHVHFNDNPDRHHPDVVKQYPRNWRPADRVAPPKRGGHDRDHDGRDDHDHDHDQGR